MTNDIAEPTIQDKLSELEKLRAHEARLRRKVAIKTRLLALTGLFLMSMGLATLLIPNAPLLLNSLIPGVTQKISQKLGTTAELPEDGFANLLYEPPMYLPEFDPNLPKENRLEIESIGLTTVIGESKDPEESFRTGVWRVPDFGNPEERDYPMIVAAHRFGYLAWSNLYRRQNSFYNLPKLKVGDQVEVIWNQRRYVYEIFEGYTDSKIRDYQADLILYTCEVLNSDNRIVRKGRLLEV